jgi:hypothetical protein
VPRTGSLIWIAEPTFDEQPTVEQVKELTRWRWPVFFPLSAAIHRKLVTPIRQLRVPGELQQFPLLRSELGRGVWRLVRFVDGASQSAGLTQDPTIPIYEIVNDTMLKERIVTDWRPKDAW